MGLSQGLDTIQLIHQAFNQGFQNQLEKNKQDQKLKLDLEANKRANEELDLHRQTTAAQLKTQLAQLEQMHFENRSKLAEMIKSGTVPGNVTTQDAVGQDAMGNDIPNAQGQTQLITKNPVTFSGETLNDYQLPNEVAQQQAQQQKTLLELLAPAQAKAEALKTTAVGQAEEPFKVEASKRATAAKITENAPEIASREKIAAAAQEAENKRAQLSASATIAGHRIAAAASNYNAQANNFMLPEQVDALTGQAQLAAGGMPVQVTGKPREAIQLILAKSGQVLPDPKDIEKVNSLPAALDTMQMIKDFNTKFGTNSKLRAYANGKLADTELPTDIKAALDAINTRAIPFGKAFEDAKSIKFTNQDLKLILHGMVNAGGTEEQNKVLSNNMGKLVALGANKALVRYSPEQRQHILETQGFFTGPDGQPLPDKSSKGGSLDKNTTINNFLKTGKFVPIYQGSSNEVIPPASNTNSPVPKAIVDLTPEGRSVFSPDGKKYTKKQGVMVLDNAK